MNALVTFNNYVENVKPTTACLLPADIENDGEALSRLIQNDLPVFPISEINTKNLVEVDEYFRGLYVDTGNEKYFIFD